MLSVKKIDNNLISMKLNEVMKIGMNVLKY